MFKKFLIVAGIIIFTIPIFSYAHPGKTDAYGCHTCRTNCASWGLSTGEYHCHNAKSLPQPKEPVTSHYGEGGTGYTEPAPQYKQPTIQQITPPPPTTNNSFKQVSVNEQIKILIEAERVNYYKNPHWFRERLIDTLTTRVKTQKPLVASFVYQLLLDVK